MWGKCGENVGKILYKKALQVSVGPFLVPGADAPLLWYIEVQIGLIA